MNAYGQVIIDTYLKNRLQICGSIGSLTTVSDRIRMFPQNTLQVKSWPHLLQKGLSFLKNPSQSCYNEKGWWTGTINKDHHLRGLFQNSVHKDVH